MHVLRLMLLAATALAVGCSSTGGARPTPLPTVAARTAVPSPAAGGAGASAAALSTKQWSSAPAMTIDPSKQYTAVIHTTKGDVTVQLFADEVPQTVNNFVFLAHEDFYDNAPFHRIMKDFMIQTGDGQRGNRHRRSGIQVRGRASEARLRAGHRRHGKFGAEHERQPVLHHARQSAAAQELHDLRSASPLAWTWSTPSPTRPCGPALRGEPSVPTEDVHITHVDIQES